jgi:protein translocase SecG subunit
MERTALIIVLVISGILFSWSVLLMSPKWWLGMGIGGASWAGDYGSKKSVEGTLKKVAIFSLVVFMACVIFLPYNQ